MPGKVVNRHRGLRPGELTQQYRRARDAYVEEVDDDPAGENLDYYSAPWATDDYWRYDAGASVLEFFLHRATSTALRLPLEPLLPGAAPEPEPPRVPRSGEELPEHLAQHFHVLKLPEDLAPRYWHGSLHQLLPALDGEMFRDLVDNREICGARRAFERAVKRSPQLARWVRERPEHHAMLLVLAPFWLRPLASFSPPVLDEAPPLPELSIALVRHLLVEYPVPPQLLSAWHEDELRLKWVLWLVLLGQGASLHRAAPRFGWEVPAKLVAHLFEAPAELEMSAALMWAEVRRLGGTDRVFGQLCLHGGYHCDPTQLAVEVVEQYLLARPVLDASLCEQRRFWLATVEWLVRHGAALDDAETFAVLTWAMHRHTEDLRPQEPAAPAARFSWRGRTAASALAHANAYHVALGIAATQQSTALIWPRRGWDWSSERPEGTWSIRELSTAAELAIESVAMSHCVATYAYRCAQGTSAIFSLTKDGARCATIELVPSTRNVAQARGKHNRACNAAELLIIAVWLAELRAREAPAGASGETS